MRKERRHSTYGVEFVSHGACCLLACLLLDVKEVKRMLFHSCSIDIMDVYVLGRAAARRSSVVVVLVGKIPTTVIRHHVTLRCGWMT